MRLLLLSDVECPALWDFFRPERIEGIDLIVSCGDLKRAYLEFLVTMSRVPVFYVPGNHDTAYIKNPPEGCECIDGQVVTYRGLRFLGLGGCIHYNDSPYQYTEEEMARRVKKLRHALRKAGGVDIVVTHAPIAGCGDQEDRAHRGFACFRQLVEEQQPKYFVHGHVHVSYGANIPRLRQCGGTTVINAYERYILEVETPEGADSARGVKYLTRRRRRKQP